MTKPRLSDPGGEIADAPIGSEDWAKRWRLDMRYIWHNIAAQPERFVRFWELGEQHRAWTLLNKSDGSKFRSFDEFCFTNEPWGLSASPEEVRQWLGLVKGQKAADLDTVSEPIVQAGPGRGHKSAKEQGNKTMPHDAASFSRYTNGRLRAINRAPEPIRKLYEQNKLSQKWAARLGPQNPSPELAGRIAAVVIALKSVPDRKSADAVVRLALGARPPSKVDKAFAIVKTMTPAERKTLLSRVRKLS